MKVLLIKDVYKLGRAGDIKKVANGYGRNYLIPRVSRFPQLKTQPRSPKRSPKRQPKSAPRSTKSSRALPKSYPPWNSISRSKLAKPANSTVQFLLKTLLTASRKTKASRSTAINWSPNQFVPLANTRSLSA